MREAAPALEPVSESPRLATRLLQLAIVGVAVYFTARLVSDLDWRQLLERMASGRRRGLGLAAVCLLARFVAWDLRWRLAFSRLGEVPGFLASFSALLAAAFVNHVTPSARVLGGLLRARYMAREGSLRFGSVYGVVLFDQIAHQVVVVTVTWLAVAGMFGLAGRPLLAGAGLLSLALVGVFVERLGRRVRWRLDAWVSAAAERAGRRGRRSEAAVRHGRDAVRAVHRLLRDASLRRRSVLYGLAFVLLNALAFWLVAAALGGPTDLLTALLAVALGTAAGALTATPGGLGTTEAGMIVVLVALGSARPDAVAATVVYRGLHYLEVLLLGMPALLGCELRWRRGG